MRNIKHDADDTLRAEYKRSDFGEMVQGKHAAAEVEFSELVRLSLSCIAQDEGVKFIRRSEIVSHLTGKWTYEFDYTNQITLRYWSDELNSIEETISGPCRTTTPQDRAELQNLLIQCVRQLKRRASKAR